MYVLGILMTFGGCGASCGLTLWQSSDRVAAMQRVVMPGTHELELAAGDHVIYAESRSTVDGTAYAWSGGTLKCGVESADGQSVPLETSSVDENYSFSGHEGQSMFTFEAATAGRYRLGCELDSGPMVVAVSHGHVLGSMWYSMLGGFAVAAAGLTMILLTWDKRRQRHPT